MKILIVHEVSYLDKIVYEYQILPEMLSMLGHEMTVVDYDETWRSHSTRAAIAGGNDKGSGGDCLPVCRRNRGSNAAVARTYRLLWSSRFPHTFVAMRSGRSSFFSGQQECGPACRMEYRRH